MKVLTPMFMGGADPEGAPELRAGFTFAIYIKIGHITIKGVHAYDQNKM